MGIIYLSGKNKLPVLIDDEDLEKVSKFRWYLHRNGYAVRNRSNLETSTKIPLKMHRLILNTPTNLTTDHINHNKLDNRKKNLRICTRIQNNFNRKRKSNNTSGLKGVHFSKVTGKWMARVGANGIRHYLGVFETKEEAFEAYKVAAQKYHGEFVNLS